MFEEFFNLFVLVIVLDVFFVVRIFMGYFKESVEIIKKVI